MNQLPLLPEVVSEIVGMAYRGEPNQHLEALLETTVERIVAARTSALRNALIEMRENHGRRFPLAGACCCDACILADKEIGASN